LEELAINRDSIALDLGADEALRTAHSTARAIGFSRADAPDVAATFGAKLAAMNALAALPPFEPVASVAYQSQGRLLIIADDAAALSSAISNFAASSAADSSSTLSLAVLWTGATPAPTFENVEVVSGRLVSLTGYLGEFALSFQAPGSDVRVAPFDLVLDCAKVPAFAMHSPPQGYFHAPNAKGMQRALAELPEMTGEFEKPKFFAYKSSICAHSRSKKTGCDKCIDVCSTAAISPDGDGVKVDPHLCMGCGACAAVCPTGAMTYQYPRVADRGAQLRALISTYNAAAPDGPRPIVLFHNATDGRDALSALVAKGAGLPAHVLPLETWHVGAIGLDVMLGAVAYGAAGVALLSQGSEAPQYREATQREMSAGQAILSALGFRGRHFAWVAEGAASLSQWASAETVSRAATFHLGNDKRATIEFAVEHLLSVARVQPQEVALPPGAMFGRVDVDKQKCTLCLACAGACPASALMDGADLPRLNFLERNCVQCGLCETTCPENAISLTPRLLLTPLRKQARVLNESEPFGCVSCGKALGTKLMIDNMLGKLAGHSMFQGEGALNRLKMCADCRVVDMMSNKREYSILTGRPLE
jgi:ferredoxin